MPDIKLPDGKKIQFSKTIDGFEIAQKIINEKLSVRDTENYIKKLQNKPPKPKKESPQQTSNSGKDEDIVIIENHVSEKLGMDVTIVDTDDGGKFIIEFHNLEQLDFIIKKLGDE